MADNVNKHTIDNNIENSKTAHSRKDMTSLIAFCMKNKIVLEKVCLT